MHFLDTKENNWAKWKTREIIMDMAEVQMAIYGKTVSLIGEMDNLMIAKEAIEFILF